MKTYLFILTVVFFAYLCALQNRIESQEFETANLYSLDHVANQKRVKLVQEINENFKIAGLNDDATMEFANSNRAELLRAYELILESEINGIKREAFIDEKIMIGFGEFALDIDNIHDRLRKLEKQ